MTSKMVVLTSVCGLTWTALAVAGDAVAIGYNPDGLWTAVTYYRSSTPMGGGDYKNQTEAEAEALRDLRRRAPEQLTQAKILSASDTTGYVAIGRGKRLDGSEENVVGRGKTQLDADREAFSELGRLEAARTQRIVYRYFTYGTGAK